MELQLSSIWQNIEPTLVATALAAWLIHVGLYLFYANKYRASIDTPKFVALHSLEAALVFGLVYFFGLRSLDSIGLIDLVITGVVTLLADGLLIAFGREYIKPLVTRYNVIFPVLAAGTTVFGAYALLS